jgi:tRNA A58 N-methylase Trm61
MSKKKTLYIYIKTKNSYLIHLLQQAASEDLLYKKLSMLDVGCAWNFILVLLLYLESTSMFCVFSTCVQHMYAP